MVHELKPKRQIRPIQPAAIVGLLWQVFLLVLLGNRINICKSAECCTREMDGTRRTSLIDKRLEIGPVKADTLYNI